MAWLAQRMDKTAMTRLLRCSWEAVADIVSRVVADQLDDARLEEVYRIGVDEVSYCKGHRYLTVVADHDRDGAVIWAGEGKTAPPSRQFYDQLGETRSAHTGASARSRGGVQEGHRHQGTPARQCADPFHVIAFANRPSTRSRRWAGTSNATKPGPPEPAETPLAATAKTSAAQLGQALPLGAAQGPDNLDPNTARRAATNCARSGSVLYRCSQLKEGLRDLYRLADPTDAPIAPRLVAGLGLPLPDPRIRHLLPDRPRQPRTGSSPRSNSAVSNSKLEGLNSKIRLINHRGYGHHTPQPSSP